MKRSQSDDNDVVVAEVVVVVPVAEVVVGLAVVEFAASVEVVAAEVVAV